MAQVGNTDNRFSGEYMVQDQDHLSGSSAVPQNAKRGSVRQAEQSHGDAGQQGGEKVVGRRKASEGRRQSE